MNKLQIKNNEEFCSYINSIDYDKFIEDLENNPDLVKNIIDNSLFWKNLNIILKKFDYETTFDIFKFLFYNDVEKKFLNEEMYILLESNIEFYMDYLFLMIIKFINQEYPKVKQKFYNLLEHIIKTKDFHLDYNVIEYLYISPYKYIIKDNFYNVLNNCYDVFELRKLVKRSKILTNKLNNYINNNPSKMIYSILINGFGFSLENIKKEKIYDTLQRIIYELINNEKVSYSDIKFIGLGAYSYAVSIGTKVLKVGKQRETFKMENNKRFLKPILRTEINKVDSSEVLGCVEITEKVKTGRISRENIYKIYKELRESGYVWVDAIPSNLGRLLRKNKIYFDGLNPTKEAINYTSDINKELDEGELIFIDNDYIFTEEEFFKKFKNFDINGIDEFEIRYQNEKRQNKGLTKQKKLL